MSDFGQDATASFITHAWKFIKGESEISKVKAMTPAELAIWRPKELQRIHDEAVKMASMQSDKDLQKMGTTRAEEIRGFEVLLRNRRGVMLSQYVLEGMDVRGLDMSQWMKGAVNQQQIERAIGDKTTKLPPDIVMPARWRSPTVGSGETDL